MFFLLVFQPKGKFDALISSFFCTLTVIMTSNNHKRDGIEHKNRILYTQVNEKTPGAHLVDSIELHLIHYTHN